MHTTSWLYFKARKQFKSSSLSGSASIKLLQRCGKVTLGHVLILSPGFETKSHGAHGKHVFLLSLSRSPAPWSFHIWSKCALLQVSSFKELDTSTWRPCKSTKTKCAKSKRRKQHGMDKIHQEIQVQCTSCWAWWMQSFSISHLELRRLFQLSQCRVTKAFPRISLISPIKGDRSTSIAENTHRGYWQLLFFLLLVWVLSLLNAW